MKKKIFAIALVVCVLALSIASASMAYFTDTEDYTNVFTAGNVDITLTANAEDFTTADGVVDLDQYVYPGLTIENNVVITNVGSEDAYVGAIITISGEGLGTILGTADGTNKIPVAISNFLTTLVTDGDDYKVNVVATEKDANDVVTEYTVYIAKLALLNGERTATDNASAVTSATLFTAVSFPTTWDNAQMASVDGLKVTVKAYATQTVGQGFTDAVSALTTAFPSTFVFN